MTEAVRPDILFVINPKSGSQKKEYESEIRKHPVSSKYNSHVFYLPEKESSKKLDDVIQKIKPKIIVAVGGDGTVNLVAGKVIDTEIVLGILPAGSANGMAKELNISDNPEDALTIIENGYVKQVDTIYINNMLCLHLADVGLNAQLVKYFEEGNIRGYWGYAKVALKVFFSQRYMQVSIKYDNKMIRRKAVMVVIANASKYGTGAVINPTGSVFDGIFEVVVIKQMGLMTLLKMWFKPSGLSPYHTEVIPAEEVSIQTHRKMHFQIDGEYIGKVQQIHAQIAPAKLNILIQKEK